MAISLIMHAKKPRRSPLRLRFLTYILKEISCAICITYFPTIPYFPRIGYLSDVRNKSFTISSEIQESIDMAAPSLDDVFQKFEGQWIFDEDRVACVGIERTESCAYGVEGSNWTVWVTGGDIISDLDIWLYKRQHHI